jgi:2-iminoacetate synthase
LRNNKLNYSQRFQLRYYGKNGIREKGYKLIAKNLEELDDDRFKVKLKERLERVKQGERDLYF